MADDQSGTIVERLTEAMNLRAYGNSGSHSYVTLSQQPGALVLSPYTGKQMELPKGQGDDIIGSAANNLSIALQTAGITITTAEEKDGLTSQGTAPVRIAFDDKENGIERKLDKAVELSTKLRKLEHAISNWFGNWYLHSGNSLGVNIKPLSMKDGKLGLIIDAHDSSVTGPLRPQGSNDGKIPASFMPQLGKLFGKLADLGMDLRTMTVSNTASPHYRGDSVAINIPAAQLEKISLRPGRSADEFSTHSRTR